VTATDVVVVGGGIAGLAAAWELATGTQPCRVTLLEATGRLGGKIGTSAFAGIELDTGPDAFLVRVPAAAQLAREAGLGDELVAPGTGQAWLWTGSGLRRLPSGLVLGVPVDVAALARSRALPPLATARAALDLVLPGQPVAADEDVSVGWLVRRRMGRAVQLDLVDPLLGGINAGHTDHLSAAVAAPQLLAAARREASLVRALRAAGTGGTASGAVTEQAPAGRNAVTERAAAGTSGAVTAEAAAATSGAMPEGAAAGTSDVAGLSGAHERPHQGAVFLTVRGGLARLVEAVARGLEARGATVRTGAAVAGLERTADGWTVRCADGEAVHAAAVVIACPSAELASAVSPVAGAELAAIEWASVVLVSLAYRAADAPAWEGSGFLVPRRGGRFVTAASWVGQKWPHLAVPGMVVVRASAGRVDDPRPGALDDGELVAAVHGDLRSAMGLRGGPVEARVSRWPGAFPQYEVGHLARTERIERRLAADAPGVVLAGAALRGVGLATCIAGGRAAAARARARVDEVRPGR
jgi:oxygen-dependent protoporphyrinogen oxidase